MAKDFFVILTETGRAKLANAVALGRTVSLTHCAVGDGAGQAVTPDAAQTALTREVYRAQLNTLETDPDNPAYIVAELVIPSEEGGWTIREAGIIDADGDLFAVGNLPETYKPQIAEGSAAELRVRLVMEVSNTAAVELKVDPTVVLASRGYVDAQVVEVRTLLETHTARTDDPHHTIPEGGEPGQVLVMQEDGSVAWGSVAGVPVSQLCWSTTGVPLPGTVPANVKQKFLRGTYPQLDEAVLAAGNYLTDEAAWDAEAAAQDGSCGRYCVTAEHIILPCYRHYIAAARSGVAGKEAGDWLADETEKHQHTIPWGAVPAESTTWTPWGVNPDYTDRYGANTADTDNTWVMSEPVGGEETRPKTLYALPCIKVADVAINAAQVDLLALADQVAAINGSKVDRSEWTQNLGTSGWQKLPSGLILQWGVAPEVTNGVRTPVSFPIAFTTACLSLQITLRDNGSGQGVGVSPAYENLAVTGFDFSCQNGYPGLWQAIGY
ncbi:phage tail protein [Desulfobaculum sp. SPO524]|uniref:phage tail protein n=1 Tax=Desulfobaculum sp. SPO524 TaxID=3378071 RepID=UPI003854DD7D